MHFEYSYGVIPLRKQENGQWDVLLVKHASGHWGFPKGHAEVGETAQTAAMRELKEETDLDVVGFISPLPLEEHYKVTRKDAVFMKTVTYFLGVVDGEVTLQEEEVCECEWVPLEEAGEKVTYTEAKMICKLARGQINSISS